MRRIADEGIRLLDRIGQGELAGDLAEELHLGRSPAWVLAQAMAAVVGAAATAVRSQPYLTFRAVATAWITLQIVNGQWPFAPHLGITGWLLTSAGGPFVMVTQYVACGWVVARLHRENPVPLVFASAGFLTLTNAVYVMMRTLGMMRFRPSWFAVDFVAMPIVLLLPLVTIVGGLWGADFWRGGPLDRDMKVAR